MHCGEAVSLASDDGFQEVPLKWFTSGEMRDGWVHRYMIRRTAEIITKVIDRKTESRCLMVDI